MAQHDYNIANQTGLEFRADLNNMAEAIVTQNSGPTEPTVTYAGMKWLDTSTSPPIEKRRNAANSAWETTLTEAGRAVAGAADAAAQLTAMGAQAALVSGTNIKTINGQSLLASGNLEISAGLSAASTAQAQAYASDAVALTPLKMKQAMQGANVSLATNGYQKLPSGLIIQWGKSAPIPPDGGIDVIFPIAFPVSAYTVSCVIEVPNDIDGNVSNYRNLTKSGFRPTLGYRDTAPANLGASWIAIGY